MDERPNGTHVCPWWLMHVFDNPVRWLFQNPRKILSGIIREGSRVLDIGCGMGYFTIPIAVMVGPGGEVWGADLQEEMLAGVRRRAQRAGVLGRVHLHRSSPDGIGVPQTFDFVLAHWMVHEVPDQKKFLAEVRSLLNASGKFLLVEPKVHVSKAAFDRTVETALAVGLKQEAVLRVGLSRGVLFTL